MKIKRLSSLFIFLMSLGVWSGEPIDIRTLPYTDEMNIVAIDVAINPTNMPNVMLWDLPIMMLYREVDNFNNIDVDLLRAEIADDFVNGRYQPLVIRTHLNQDLTLNFMNLVGLGDAPQRLVQGVVCKNCTNKRAYTFSYGQDADRSKYPWFTSIHGHGMAYTIDNDGTRAGMNMVANATANDGLVAPGETRTYYYKKLDMPGLWPLHDHGNPSHTISRGLHMALVVEGEEKVTPDHDFLMMFSDYPDYDNYLDEFYTQTFVPPFIHMRNANVMHAHALNGYAAMLPPRMNMATAGGNTPWDAMRTDVLANPRTPVFEVVLGELVRIRLMSFGAVTTHSFHLHGHVWWDKASSSYQDNTAVPAGNSYEMMFYAGGPPFRQFTHFTDVFGNSDANPGGDVNERLVRSGTGDWLYHCHIISHVKHGMWGIFRVTEPADGLLGDDGK